MFCVFIGEKTELMFIDLHQPVHMFQRYEAFEDPPGNDITMSEKKIPMTASATELKRLYL